MTKIIITVLFLCINFLNGYAQGNVVNQKIQQAKRSGESFEAASAFTSVSGSSAQNT